MKDTTKIELKKLSECPVRTGVYRQKVGELEFTYRKQENWSSLVESMRSGVYRQKVGETCSLQTESGRTGVCELIFFKQIKKLDFILLCVLFLGGAQNIMTPPPSRDTGVIPPLNGARWVCGKKGDMKGGDYKKWIEEFKED